MIIHRMRATFGKLEEKELVLQPGLNVISGGNETGKSTWLAFLMAMLYGVDTKERVRAGSLPDKIKYQPWSGKPMAGSMELSDGERTITLERTSVSAPLSDFRAYDSATGTPCEELTGRSCGQTLLGVEAGVYARSGYLRQQRLPFSADACLEKRLSSLVTGGSEDYSFAEIDEKLKKQQTALRHNQSGALPRAEARCKTLREKLDEIEQKQRRLTELELELTELRAQRDECRDILSGLEALEQRERRETLEAAEAALSEAAEDRKSWENVCAGLPEEAVLQSLEAELQQVQSDLQRVALEEGATPDSLELPESDPVFGRMSPKEAHDKAVADANLVHDARNAKRPRRRLTFPWLIVILLGLGAGFYGAEKNILYLVAAGVALSLLGLAVWLSLRVSYSRKAEAYLKQMRKVREILDQYEVTNSRGIVRRAADYIRSLDTGDPYNSVTREILASIANRRDAILAELSEIMPGCDSVERAAMLFQEAAQSRQSLSQARLVEQQRIEQLKDLQIALGPSEEHKVEAERLAGHDRQTEAARLESLDEQITEKTELSARITGAISQMGDRLALSAELEEQQQRIGRMEERYAALQLARHALMEADEAVRARFAPILCEKTGKLFARLTAGKYDEIQLDRNLHVTVHPKGSAVFRPLSFLSCGTVDQLYLALRLAICELLIPNAPIVLDDALVYFDEERATLALQVLRELGKTRQILIFTCHRREKRILNELASKKGAKAPKNAR